MTHVFRAADGSLTKFTEDAGACYPTTLLGLPMGRTLLSLATDRGLFAPAMQFQVSQATATTLLLTWKDDDTGLSVDSHWDFCTATGIWSRHDRVVNAGHEPITIHRALSCLSFAPGRYETYSQGSAWSYENQGHWHALTHGGIELRCEGGRTCQGASPYLALREIGSDTGIAVHLLPQGNWIIRLRAVTTFPGPEPRPVLQMGLADEMLHCTLKPGEHIDLPVMLLQRLPDGQPHLAAASLHRYLLDQHLQPEIPAPPVIYNTWFDQFETLEVPRLRRQLAAAREMGCEMFVVDAGWYGNGVGDWFAQGGDWREKQDGAFYGKMREFSDEVRAAGLAFGLWCEPERVGVNTPIAQAHPKWLVPTGSPYLRFALEEEPVREYLFDELSRLVTTYQLKWMKIDFNFELGTDPYGTELHRYYAGWYCVLDRLRTRFPETYFEGCAGGGMRLDLHTLAHFHGHFLSDTVNPVDVLHIYQGALLRLPPGRIGKWAVIRPAPQAPGYGQSGEKSRGVLTTLGAEWEHGQIADLDFAAITALSGVFGVSGDVAGLAPEERSRLAQHIAFYKEWREFLFNAAAHVLTVPQPLGSHEGWLAYQLQRADDPRGLLFAFRLADSRGERSFRLRGLEPDREYRITEATGERTATGRALMQDGVSVTLPATYRAAIISIR